MNPMQSSIMFLAISIIFSVLSFIQRMTSKISIKFSIMELNSAQYSFELFIDWKLISFISVVSFITGNIMIYSESYMMTDKNKKRFTIILTLFAMSMIWTIMTSKNIMSMLIGWDFLGLSSMLLIIHYQSMYVYNFGMITFILNRLGDIGFIMAGAYMFNMGSWSLFNMLESMNIILILLTFAAFTKSAQLPFSTWLPKAMAAPTPVSALVHSSTLVTAGVIILIRLEPYMINKNFSLIMLVVSTTSMMVGSMAAMIDYDLKKIIAFSTLSQISFMMVILFMNSINLAFLHLIIHALFKSLMFMSAGTIIHHSMGEQDIRKINMMSVWLPLETTLMNLSMLALMGFPFYSGFFSKDLMIEFYSNSSINFILLVMLDLSICMTSFYSVRLSLYICWNNWNKNLIFNMSTSYQEKFVMMMFMIPIIMSGSLMSWFFIKNKNMEIPLPIYLKMFGLWGSIITIILTCIIIKLNKMTNLYYSWLLNSLIFIDFMFPLLAKISMLLSNMYMKYNENMWNKFMSSIMMNNTMKMLKSNKKYYPNMMVKNITILSFLYLVYMYLIIN